MRLVEAGADLSRVMVIDDTEEALTLSDDRMEKAVRQNHVRLVIIDPVQAFIGADVDMNRANEVRPVSRKLGDEDGFRWVEAYEISADELLDGKEGKATETKLERGAKLIRELLAAKKRNFNQEIRRKGKGTGNIGRTMRDVRSRMKNELEYQINEKQENNIRLKERWLAESLKQIYTGIFVHNFTKCPCAENCDCTYCLKFACMV